MIWSNYAGMQTALVLTGVTQFEQLPHASVQPDFVLASIALVPALLSRLKSGG